MTSIDFGSLKGHIRYGAALDELDEILKGIDEQECVTEDGWWETSYMADYGAGKLAEVKALIIRLIDGGSG